jgi:hypothetical protein
VRVFRQKVTLEDVIGSHAFLAGVNLSYTVNFVQILKANLALSRRDGSILMVPFPFSPPRSALTAPIHVRGVSSDADLAWLTDTSTPVSTALLVKMQTCRNFVPLAPVVVTTLGELTPFAAQPSPDHPNAAVWARVPAALAPPSRATTATTIPPSTNATLPAVHLGIICDGSGMNPVVGTRYHLIDADYDLCEAEYAKVPGEEQTKYTAMEKPVAEQSMFSLAFVLPKVQTIGSLSGARFPTEMYTRGYHRFHAFSLDASRRVPNDIPLGWPHLLSVGTVNGVQTLKAGQFET